MYLLTEKNKIFLDEHRERIRAAHLERSKNPSDFKSVMAFLYAFEAISNNMKRDLNSPFKRLLEVVGPLINNSNSLNLKPFLEEVESYLYTSEFKIFVTKELQKEPRITDLRVNISEDYSPTIFKPRKTIYKIAFSDDDVIEWNAPFTGNDLIEIRQRFESKMEQLSIASSSPITAVKMSYREQAL